MDTLPFEILREIIAYFDLKSLVRFSRVCKLWKTVICDIFKCNLHLYLNYETQRAAALHLFLLSNPNNLTFNNVKRPYLVDLISNVPDNFNNAQDFNTARNFQFCIDQKLNQRFIDRHEFFRFDDGNIGAILQNNEMEIYISIWKDLKILSASVVKKIIWESDIKMEFALDTQTKKIAFCGQNEPLLEKLFEIFILEISQIYALIQP